VKNYGGMTGELKLWNDVILSAAYEVEKTCDKHWRSLLSRGGSSQSWSTEMHVFSFVAWLMDYPFTEVVEGNENLGTRASWMRYDCERVFADLAHLDVRRATWCYLTRRHQCEEIFVRFVDFMTTACKGLLTSVNSHGNLHSIGAIQDLGIIIDALWQVTCHIPHPLAPSAPPPPYTLHAFNIELPAMEWPQAQAEDVRLWSTKSDVTCRRTPPKETQHAIVRNLLRLAAEPTVVARDVPKPRIFEIVEDSEDGEEEKTEQDDAEAEDDEEGEGAPLPGSP
jgi:hypothetical protein